MKDELIACERSPSISDEGAHELEARAISGLDGVEQKEHREVFRRLEHGARDLEIALDIERLIVFLHLKGDERLKLSERPPFDARGGEGERFNRDGSPKLKKGSEE